MTPRDFLSRECSTLPRNRRCRGHKQMAANESCVEFVEGWLHVWELVRQQEDSAFSHGHRPEPQWEPRLCVFRSDTGTFSSFESEQKWTSEYVRDFSNVGQQTVHTRLDGGIGCFHSRWGYKVAKKVKDDLETNSRPSDSEDDRSSAASTPTSIKTMDISRKSSSDSSQRSGDNSRRESCPLETTRTESMESVSTTFWLVNFFIKKGFSNSQKSASKTERKVSGSNFTDLSKALLNSKDKSARSHESVLGNAPSMQSIDLTAPNVEVKPLHSSVLGQGHCIQVATPQGSKYISCTTSEEMDSWLFSLRRTTNPQDEQSRRFDSSLKIWIVEAKNVTPKRRYFCDILLDHTLYAKTSIKTMTDMLFWGEHFELKNLPPVELITVNLYREADKKKKKEKNLLLGYINLPIADLENRQVTEKWINCQSGTVGKTGKEAKSELPIIRVKARRQTVDILPLEFYQSFIKYLRADYKELCRIFEPLLAVKEKEDFATCLVHVLQTQGKACEFLADIVIEEISRLDDEHLTFRGNSIATKAMEAYMKLVGGKYLHNTLGDLINQLVQSPDDCEVDPTKVATPQLLSCQQKNLDMYSNMAWVKVINSFCYFPNELREVFSSFRGRCSDRGKEDYSDNLISGCIFLRFLCPAILYPSLFNLTQEYPNERASRTLTLIAKTIQTLANFTQFGIKEDYMTFMNAFVEREAPNMKMFLRKISSGETSNQFLQFDGQIDLGKELSVLHALLLESTGKYSGTAGNQFEELQQILAPLTVAFEDPTIGQKRLIRKSQAYDNMTSMSLQSNEASLSIFNQSGINLGKKPGTSLQLPLDSGPDFRPRRPSSDELPGSKENSSNNSHGLTRTSIESVNASRSRSFPAGAPEFRNVSVVRPNQINIGRTANNSFKRTTSDDGTGDYVDLVQLPDKAPPSSLPRHVIPDSPNQPGQPLAFANPLFGHQQSQQGRHRAFGTVGPESHAGVHVSQAQTVQRASSGSSSSDSDDEDVPWLVKLAKTSSPLVESASIEHHLSCEALQQLEQFESFYSNDSGQSSFSNSSFYTCSSDFTQSASSSYISPLSPNQPTSSTPLDESINGYSTFPRRQRGQQEMTTITNVKPSPILPNESKNTSSEEGPHSTPLSNRGITFNRQFSSPNHGSMQTPRHDAMVFANRPGENSNKTVNIQQGNFQNFRNASDGLSTSVYRINQIRNDSICFNSSRHPPSRDNTTFSNRATFPGNTNPGTHQRPDGSSPAGSQVYLKSNSSTHIMTSTNTATEGVTSFTGNPRITPSAITKSAGWKIALKIDLSSAREKNSNLKDSSAQNLPSPAHDKVSSMHESGSGTSINSSPSSAQIWDYAPYPTDSPSSVRNYSKPHSKSEPSASQRDLPASRALEDTPITSKSSSTSVFSSQIKLNNANQPQNKSTLPSLNPRPPNLNEIRNNSISLDSNPLPKPPAFLISKYAIVRPHITSLDQRLHQTRAASYHSPQERSKSSRPFTTSRSLDLGLVYNPPNVATTSPGGTEAALNHIPGGLSPTQPSSRGSSTFRTSSQRDSFSSSVKVPSQSSSETGITSVIRKLKEQEKTKQEFEKEVHVLRQQLLEAQERLHQTELRLLDNEMDTQKLMGEMQNRLAESEETMRRKQAQKDVYMETIIDRLHLVEEELKKEQAEMVKVIEHKQQVIEVQERRIENLDLANKRLIQALADLEGRESTDEGTNSSSTCNGVMGNDGLSTS